MTKKRDAVFAALHDHDRDLESIIAELGILQAGLDEYAPGRSTIDQLLSRISVSRDRLHFRIPALDPKLITTRMGAKKLIATRERLGLSQASVASALGTSQSHYSKIERGLTQPGGAIMLRLAKLLGSTAEELFDL